jgi:erlin
MEKESEKKIADIEVQMHVNREKSLADAEFYKALKETESNKVNFTYIYLNLIRFTNLRQNIG